MLKLPYKFLIIKTYIKSVETTSDDLLLVFVLNKVILDKLDTLYETGQF